MVLGGGHGPARARARRESALGAGRLSALEAGLRTMVPDEAFRLDVPGWFGA